MEKQLTALEWLEQNMPNLSEYIPLGIVYEFTAKLQKAKELEKEQLKDFYIKGNHMACDCYDWVTDKDFEEEYKKEFEKL
jgi:hydroxymethylpyrimidine/phosphomethylpyrimidine kinase